MKNLEFVNVFENPCELHEVCTAEGWTDLDFETWFEKGGELDFFDGDPDIIKADGQTGYFCKFGNKVYYYLDDWTGTGLDMLKAFFGAFETGVTLGGYSWLGGETPEGVDEGSDIQNWKAFENIENGIAYRGGAGYVYRIFDFSKFVENLESVAA